MAPIKKYIVALLVMAFCSSCSYLIGLHGLGPVYQKRNKGKEKDLVLEISLRNDTLYANENANLEMTANLKYVGNGYYYFDCTPLTWRMDGGVTCPNSFHRTFYYGNEKCRVMEDLIMHNEHRISHYLLRSGKCLTLEHSLDMNRLLCPSVKLPFDADYIETARNWRNTEYGEYQMELCYITESQDTIRSNIVTFWYLEKRE